MQLNWGGKLRKTTTTTASGSFEEGGGLKLYQNFSSSGDINYRLIAKLFKYFGKSEGGGEVVLRRNPEKVAGYA